MQELLSADDFPRIVNEYSDTIYRIAMNQTHSPQDSFDICQEVFVKLVENRHKIKDESHLKAWLIRVAVNTSKSWLRRADNRLTVGLSEVAEVACAPPLYDNSVSEAIRQLPEKSAIVIHLFYYEEMKISDISKALGITQSAVKLRLKRGREKLKSILEKED